MKEKEQNTVSANKKFIDIQEVIKKKNPQLIKWMPGFLLRYVKRILHEDDSNDFMRKYGHLYGLEFVNMMIEDFDVKVKIRGSENIPLNKSVIFVSNHPLGGFDGIALMYAIGQYRRDIQFLVNDILLNIKNLEELFVPINKHGAQGREALKRIEKTYAGDFAILQFPAGLVSRKGSDGRVRDLEWKKSFISKAKKYQKDVIPVFIDGRNSNFFYNLARLRERLGVKANLEMFYLADEMFSQKGKEIEITIGEEISHHMFDNSKTENQWAELVKQKVYGLNPDKN